METPQVIKLDREAWERFLHALANPKPPTEALKRLMRPEPELKS